jgi:N-acetylmuramoyl-L-alanine amidase
MIFFNHKTFLTLLFAVFAGAVLEAAPIKLRSIWANKIQWIYLPDVAAGLSSAMLATNAQYTFAKGKNQLKLYPAKRYVMINNVRVNLCHPLLIRDKKPYISRLDYENIFLPFLGKKAVYKHKIGTIVIDSGHGGHDRGAAGKKLIEKHVTLNLAGRVANILRQYGYNVKFTRTRDTALSLEQRGAYTQKADADLFISIHVNSAADRSVEGIESFCLTPEGAASSNSGKPDSTRYAGNAKNKNNFLLAYNLQRSMLTHTKATDRGVKFARFAVLRPINCPGVLIEVGFVSNFKEEANLGSAAYQDKLARGIAAGILNYHRSLSL